MVMIDEELEAAKAAQAVISTHWHNACYPADSE
jgi:hypothetical protein